MKTASQNIFLTISVVVIAMVPLLASAEKYIEISRSDLTGQVTLFDVDSPRENLARKGVEFKYRTISDAPLQSGKKTVIEYTEVAWCHRMSTWTVRADAVGSGYKALIKEYYKDGVGWLEYPYVVVTNFGEPHGKLVAAACDAGQPKEMDELMQRPSDADCLNPKDEFTKAACSTSSEMLGDMALLVRRIEMVGARCGNVSRLKDSLSAASAGLKHCYGGDKCIRRQLADLVFAVNTDARELEKWESSGSPQPFPLGTVCTAESTLKKQERERKDRNARYEAVAKTADEFLGCARKNIAKLDDRRSDAAVVAKVVYRPCSTEFYRALDAIEARDGKANAEELKKSFEDQLLEMVLTSRSGAGKGR